MSEKLVDQCDWVQRSDLFINVWLEQGPTTFIYQPSRHARQAKKTSYSLSKTVPLDATAGSARAACGNFAAAR
ncbi:MAG: hypothetical protein ACLPTF_23305 [Steroidobacteraceae bacterium]